MAFTPLLVDALVLALVAGVVLLPPTVSWVRVIAAWTAILASICAPPLGASVHAPDGVMAAAVVMMAVAFYGVVRVMSVSPQAAFDDAGPDESSDPDSSGPDELAGWTLSDEAWAQFERDFREYAARQARARRGHRTSRRDH
jgi:hypothetical protein